MSDDIMDEHNINNDIVDALNMYKAIIDLDNGINGVKLGHPFIHISNMKHEGIIQHQPIEDLSDNWTYNNLNYYYIIVSDEHGEETNSDISYMSMCIKVINDNIKSKNIEEMKTELNRYEFIQKFKELKTTEIDSIDETQKILSPNEFNSYSPEEKNNYIKREEEKMKQLKTIKKSRFLMNFDQLYLKLAYYLENKYILSELSGNITVEKEPEPEEEIPSIKTL
jgi:hypothetical protein